jgi:hypothetical protein
MMFEGHRRKSERFKRVITHWEIAVIWVWWKSLDKNGDFRWRTSSVQNVRANVCWAWWWVLYEMDKPWNLGWSSLPRTLRLLGLWNYDCHQSTRKSNWQTDEDTEIFWVPQHTASMACFQMSPDHPASVAHAEILKVKKVEPSFLSRCK